MTEGLSELKKKTILDSIFRNYPHKPETRKTHALMQGLTEEDYNKYYFYKIKEIFKKYLDTTELNYNLLSIWTLGTYFHKQFETYPLLTLMARKRSGKSRTLKLTSALSKGSDGSISTSVTETYLFRHREGAVFFDEMESISSKDKTALRETINATYKKGNKIVRYVEKRVEGVKTYVEECFYPFYPIGIANIHGFGDVLADRSIQLILQRSDKKQTKLVEDFKTNKDIQYLRNELFRLNLKIQDNIFSEWNNFIEGREFNEEFEDIFDSINKTNLCGRPLELFLPLFIVAKNFGVLDILIKTSQEYMSQIEGDYSDNPDDLLQNFMENSSYHGFVNVSQILKNFKESLEESEDWMNSKWLGRALKRLGFVEKKRHVNGRSQIMLKINTTNTINTINPINNTKSTNEVDIVGLVDFVEGVDKK